uniref:Poly (ADP-ribose) polymerase family, member 12a n=1 Tax=Gasterosteus aculeatus aculeatus TaxID=481459 RepID=G3PJ32_GASAC|nr:protein mono-ADP-ribosyltransferase PARP12 [Gasterosteus aculeatus aculeatus]
MTSVISKFVVKTLCDHRGSLDFQRLDEEIAQKFTVANSVLQVVLFDDAKVSIREGRQRVAEGQILSRDSLIVAKSSLRVCQRRPGECPRCDALHICKFYVCGECTFGLKCKNPHSLDDAYNAGILRRHDLQDLTEKQLFQLLLQNDPYLLPEICPHFNKGNGLHGSCKFTTACTKLHICQHHLQGDCKFGSSCKRSHEVNVQQTKALRVSQEIIKNLPEIYRNKFIIQGQRETPAVPALPEGTPPPQELCQKKPRPPAGSASPSQPPSDADTNEICLFFIRRHCSFKEKCVRVHWHLPFRWQALDSDGVTWKDLPAMEDIERAYSDPCNDTSCTKPLSPPSRILSFLSLQSSESPPTTDFVTMTHGGSPVRRLSTASSVSKPPHFILTTQWLWYWKDDIGQWLEFGQNGADGQPASVTCETLENVYLADRDTEVPFGMGKHQYVLHFKGAAGTGEMYQQNVKFKTKREVRRRPRFVSAHDVEVKLKSVPSQGSSSSAADSFPPHWDATALPDFGYKLISLSKSAKEYVMIEKLFKRTMPRRNINNIQRIQNPSLWKVFQWQKQQMKERNKVTSVNEQYLFHGTDASLIDAICEQNFDWRMCGVHGTSYGKGSYFARDASRSDCYVQVKSGQHRIMFVALVLVGEHAKGSSSFVRPPPKGNGKTLYDSCVDSQSDPSIYVVFEKQQIYPEYLIDYS